MDQPRFTQLSSEEQEVLARDLAAYLGLPFEARFDWQLGDVAWALYQRLRALEERVDAEGR